MQADEAHEGRSAAKRRAIREAATKLFVGQGYLETSMDEVAAQAAVSKQTVYKNFGDKQQLFSEIVRATADDVEEAVDLASTTLADTDDLERDLAELARGFITRLMEPDMIRLRRLIIANVDRFPELGRTWYEQGFERVFAAVGAAFQRLTERTLLQTDDPLIAANHFFGLLLWVPMNRAMFTGEGPAPSRFELTGYADTAVRVFLSAYAPHELRSRGGP